MKNWLKVILALVLLTTIGGLVYWFVFSYETVSLGESTLQYRIPSSWSIIQGQNNVGFISEETLDEVRSGKGVEITVATSDVPEGVNLESYRGFRGIEDPKGLFKVLNPKSIEDGTIGGYQAVRNYTEIENTTTIFNIVFVDDKLWGVNLSCSECTYETLQARDTFTEAERIIKNFKLR